MAYPAVGPSWLASVGTLPPRATLLRSYTGTLYFATFALAHSVACTPLDFNNCSNVRRVLRSRFDIENIHKHVIIQHGLDGTTARNLCTLVVGTTDRSGIAKVPRISSPAQTPKHLSSCIEQRGKPAITRERRRQEEQPGRFVQCITLPQQPVSFAKSQISNRESKPVGAFPLRTRRYRLSLRNLERGHFYNW